MTFNEKINEILDTPVVDDKLGLLNGKMEQKTWKK